jgi:hypothetical protein
MSKIIRITTVPISLKLLLSGQMKFMKDAGWEVLMVSADGREINEIVKKEDCRHEIIPFTRKITPFQDLSCLWQLYNLIKREKPDIVHTHTPKAGMLGYVGSKISRSQGQYPHSCRFALYGCRKTEKELACQYRKAHLFMGNTSMAQSRSLKEFIIDEESCWQEKLKVIGLVLPMALISKNLTG